LLVVGCGLHDLAELGLDHTTLVQRPRLAQGLGDGGEEVVVTYRRRAAGLRQRTPDHDDDLLLRMHVEVLAENPRAANAPSWIVPRLCGRGHTTYPYATGWPRTRCSRAASVTHPVVHAQPSGVGQQAGGAMRMAEETDTMLQPTQGGGREGGCNASYKRS
jgi:hypothetical protein